MGAVLLSFRRILMPPSLPSSFLASILSSLPPSFPPSLPPWPFQLFYLIYRGHVTSAIWIRQLQKETYGDRAWSPQTRLEEEKGEGEGEGEGGGEDGGRE